MINSVQLREAAKSQIMKIQKENYKQHNKNYFWTYRVSRTKIRYEVEKELNLEGCQ